VLLSGEAGIGKSRLTAALLEVGSGASGLASQGYSVALSADGNTAIVGGPTDSKDTGAGCWVFTRSGVFGRSRETS
jgi:hypothetical protein